MSFDVAVVGGGVLGAATALHLAGAGVRTVLLDRGAFGAEGSGLNAGTLNLMHEKASGFGDLPFRLSALGRWDTLAEELGEDGRGDMGAVTRQGTVIVAETAAETERLQVLRDGYAGAGVPVELLDGAGLRTLAPWLASGVAAALFCPLGGYADPARVAPALAHAAGRRGVVLHPGVSVAGLQHDGSGWRLDTAEGPLGAGCVVLAAGPWSAALLAPFGIEIPLRVQFFQACRTAPVPPFLPFGVRRIAGGLTLKQVGSGACVIGGGWLGLSQFPEPGRVQPSTLAENRAVAAAVVPHVARLAVAAEWGSYDGSSVSGRPILGEVPGQSGLFVSTGANEGFCQGPLLGAITAARVLGRHWAGPTPDFQPMLAASVHGPERGRNGPSDR